MTQKKLYQLLIALIGLAVLALVAKKCSHPPRPQGLAPGDALLADFDVNAITRVEVTGPNGVQSLKQKDGVWVLETLYDYPVDFSKLREHINGISVFKVGQVITDGRDFPEEFGLTTNATKIALRNEKDETLATLTIGKKRNTPMRPGQFSGFAGGGAYVQLESGDVALVDNLKDLPAQNEGWVKTRLLEINENDIDKVRVSSNKTTYTLTRKGKDDFKISRKKKSETINKANAGRLCRSLQYLTMMSVADPALSDKELGFTNAVKYTATTKDKRKYTIQTGGKIGKGQAIRISAKYKAPPPPTRETVEKEIPETGDTEEDKKKREEQIEKRLADVLAQYTSTVKNATEKIKDSVDLKEWTFIVSTYNAESFTLPRDKMVDVKEEKKAEKSKPKDVKKDN